MEDFAEGKEYTFAAKEEWDALVLKRGYVVEVLLHDIDASFPADLWGGFLVLQVYFNQATDGSMDLYVKSLGCDDPDTTKKLSGLFNRREGYLHVCMKDPCPFSESYYKHVKRLRLFTWEGFHREYITAYMRSQAKKWLEEEIDDAEEEGVPPGEEAESPFA